MLDKRFGIPIIPYMKVGLAYPCGGFGNTNACHAGKAPKRRGVDAKGGSLRLTLHPGLALDPSALDRQQREPSIREVGLISVHAVCRDELRMVNNFGQGNKLNLSDTGRLAPDLASSLGLPSVVQYWDYKTSLIPQEDA